jgi:tRNA-modifying protein YgfZ
MTSLVENALTSIVDTLPPCFLLRFEAAAVFRVAGRDARRYLNARLTNNVRDLLPGHAISAAALTPQGKTQALFTVLAVSDSEFLLYCDGGDRAAVEAALKKYLVADRVDVTNPDLTVLHLAFSERFAGQSPLTSNAPSGSVDDSLAPFNHDAGHFVLSRRRSHLPGCDYLASKEIVDGLAVSLKALDWPELTGEQKTLAAAIARRPRFPEEINESRMFLEAGLRGAVSFQKGCYVGQEVIEKVDALGKSPRVIVAFVAESSPAGQDIVDDSGSKASIDIISVGYDPGTGYAAGFASAKNDPRILTAPLRFNGKQIALLT